MSGEDYGSNRALGSAALQLVGGVLIGGGTWFGYLDGMRQPLALALGTVAAGYFVIAGAVRVMVGILTRRARR